MSMLAEVRNVLKDTLQLGANGDRLEEFSVLLGELPELDSMAVVTIITSLEERYGFIVEDDEITADTFETLGTLTRFVENKIGEL